MAGLSVESVVDPKRKFAQATLTLGRATIALWHDNAVNAVADCVFIIDADQIIEDNEREEFFKNPQNERT